MTLEDQMLLEEYQKDRKRFNEEYSEQWESLMPPKALGIVPEQKRRAAQGNHSDRAVRYETETAIEGVM